MFDTLKKWLSQVTSLRNPSYYLLGKTDFVTLNDVPMEWDALSRKFGIHGEELEFYRQRRVNLPEEVCLAALSNAWRDVQLVTVLVLITWSLRNLEGADTSLALYLAGGWVAGKDWREGDRSSFRRVK
jgi:hypothetical protein